MMDIPYVEKVVSEAVRAGATAGLQEMYQDMRVRLGVEMGRVNKMVILVSANYPPNTYSSWGKVTRRKFAANSKRVHILETAKEDQDHFL